MPIKESICQHVQTVKRTVAIPDLLDDARTRSNAFVLQNGLRSYIGTPIHTSSGKFIGALCCMCPPPREWTQNDIKLIEDLARCVDDIVMARTGVLEERKARIDLQEVLATRNGYIAHVSHEIRTPITGIVGSIKMLEKAKSEEHAKRLMSILNRSADKLLNFVNDVLDLAKFDAVYSEVTEEETDIGELAQDILNDFQVLAEAKSIGLCVKDQLAGNTYLADRAGFQTILQNLIGNAVKFTDNGSVTVSINEDSYGQIAIRVIDTGIGIAPEYHEKIFNEFEQAEAVTARTYGGTGLGMPIVKRVVNRMEGAITVESQLGRGSTFSVFVPLQIITQREVAA